MTSISLSIVIPTYRCSCLRLVASLRKQAAAVSGLEYEIIVSDDASADDASLDDNRQINDLPHCRLLEQTENGGRSVNRNRLAHAAGHEWLLFIDSHMQVIKPDFIQTYVENAIDGQITYGGYTLPDNLTQAQKQSLRARYEQHCAGKISVDRRSRQPYRNFHTSNFLIQRRLMLAHPFDERFVMYGYEDIFFGMTLQQNGVKVNHIDNPVGFNTFEDNSTFLKKTEDSLQTLHAFRSQLTGYSTLLRHANRLQRWHLMPAVRAQHRLFGNLTRRQLLGKKPSIRLFQLYKLGYYATI